MRTTLLQAPLRATDLSLLSDEESRRVCEALGADLLAAVAEVVAGRLRALTPLLSATATCTCRIWAAGGAARQTRTPPPGECSGSNGRGDSAASCSSRWMDHSRCSTTNNRHSVPVASLLYVRTFSLSWATLIFLAHKLKCSRAPTGMREPRVLFSLFLAVHTRRVIEISARE